MHPNGELPASEWASGDINSPVQAWAALHVYQVDQHLNGGVGDVAFLERIFQKLLLNFTWWVNRKDTQGFNIFEGGFLGLDNIGLFDRSHLPTGGHIQQSDGTAWMAMFCLNMLHIAVEIGQHDPVYDDMATKFFEHFLYIGSAMTGVVVPVTACGTMTTAFTTIGFPCRMARSPDAHSLHGRIDPAVRRRRGGSGDAREVTGADRADAVSSRAAQRPRGIGLPLERPGCRRSPSALARQGVAYEKVA